MGDEATKQWSDRASENGGNVGNVGGRFGRDGMRFGWNLMAKGWGGIWFMTQIYSRQQKCSNVFNVLINVLK